jgi:hypothetical protein
LCCFNKFIDRGGHWANTAQAQARWRHPVASIEAQDVLHWVICPASYRCISMAIKITSDSPAFFDIVDFVVGHNRS